ncbi:MAG: hypothetical protein RLZZ385_2663 [Pseudomonadota bacterium]|jgi:hypothetical protein
MMLDEKGFLLRKGCLMPTDAWAASFTMALAAWMQHSFSVLLAESHGPRWTVQLENEVRGLFGRGHLGTRLAILLGLGGRRVFDTLSPWVNALDSRFHPDTGLPKPAWPPLSAVLKALARDPLLRQLCKGPVSVLRWYPCFCLAEEENGLLERVTLASGQMAFEYQACLSIHTGATPWSMVCSPLSAAPGEPLDLLLLVPLSAMNRGRGSLTLLPGSHRYGPRRHPDFDELRTRRDMRLEPGDLLLLRGALMAAKLYKRNPGEGASWLVLQCTTGKSDEGDEEWPDSGVCS